MHESPLWSSVWIIWRHAVWNSSEGIHWSTPPTTSYRLWLKSWSSQISVKIWELEELMQLEFDRRFTEREICSDGNWKARNSSCLFCGINVDLHFCERYLVYVIGLSYTWNWSWPRRDHFVLPTTFGSLPALVKSCCWNDLRRAEPCVVPIVYDEEATPLLHKSDMFLT